MPVLPAEFYARWRLSVRPTPVLHEGGAPPEYRLQQIWRHQRLRRADLKTLEGRPIRVLHPGFWNHEPGPDFRGAVIQFGGEPARTGDVEIDLAVSGWRSHGHAGNPAYAGVILHVVWESAARELQPPVLALRPFLDAPITELETWLEGEAATALPENVAGQCCAPLRELSADSLAELLCQAGRVRLERKAAEFAVRARLGGWEAALWEGLFAALGYKHNGWPMRRLAELVASAAGREDALTLEARLLGLAGLLPAELPGSDGAFHARKLWDIWWRERDGWGELALPASLWRLAGIRPANHPQRRLALAAHWLAAGDLVARLENWLTTHVDPVSAPERLLAQLAPPADGSFWAHHWTLRSRRQPKPQPLLGAARLTDLAINVVLPWLLARALAGRNRELADQIQEHWFAWPAGEDNSVLKLARQRLFGGSARRLPQTAAAQQGLLQVKRDFCAHAGTLCTACQFPDLVRALPR